mmetsp:Transcript_65324/g.142328  ORF Transcript_65324/g.142328 Transcript_65324/m.142328 type:complete len:134 (-) Transcript_65324:147-548(-)
MDDWMLYQITEDPAYLRSFRVKRAVRAAAMGGSLGAIGVFSTALMSSSVTSKGLTGELMPRWIPRRAAGFGLLCGTISAVISWQNTAYLKDTFMLAPGVNSSRHESPEVSGGGASESGSTAGPGSGKGPVPTV